MSRGGGSSSATGDSPDESNTHVQELKKVFCACAVSGRLERDGLLRLCRELRLARHADFIVDRLLPANAPSGLAFRQFKRRFIALLPEVVSLPSSGEGEAGERLSPLDAGLGGSGEEAPSENDTSNDVQSDFSEDANGGGRRRRRTVVGGRRVEAAALRAAARELGLPDSGFLGRYELQILCQHSSALRRGLLGDSADSGALSRAFSALDTDGDGRVSLDHVASTANAGLDVASDGSSPAAQTEASRKRWKAELLRAKSASQRLQESLDSPRPLSSPVDYGMSASTSSLPPINFFQLIEGAESGFLRTDTVLSHWAQLGINDGVAILESLSLDPGSDVLSLNALSRRLESELLEAALTRPTLAAALLSYRAHLEFLKASWGEQRGRAEHYRAELAALNRRQNLLAEEMDASQASLEAAHQAHIQALERSWREEKTAATGRLLAERETLATQVSDLEAAVHSLHREEAGRRSRSGVLERDNVRLRRENEELSLSLGEVEALNQELRRELESQAEAMARLTRQPAESDESRRSRVPSGGAHWKHKVELLVGENKRLRDQVDELLEVQRRSAKKTSSKGWGTRWGGTLLKAPKAFSIDGKDSSAKFRKEINRLKRKKTAAMDGLDSPEFESEEEPYLFRPRVKRRLQKRQRKPTLERRVQRATSTPQPDEEDSSESSVLPSRASTSIVGSTKLRLQQLRVEMAAASETQAAELSRLRQEFEAEKEAIREQKNAEIRLILETKESERGDWAKLRETELRQEFEDEKKRLETSWENERNDADRAFAEEKMEMMARLQEDFEGELRKARNSAQKAAQQVPAAQAKPKGFLGRLASNNVSPAVSLGSVDRSKVEDLEKDKKILEDSLAGQRNGFEARIAAMKKAHETRLAEIGAELHEMQNWETSEDLPTPLKARFESICGAWRAAENEKLAAERARLEADRTSLAEATAQQELLRTTSEAALESRLEEERAALRAQKAERLAELEEKLAAAEASRSASATQLGDLQRQHERATVEKALVIDGQRSHESAKAELQSRLDAVTEENSRLRAQFDGRIRELESDFQAQLAELREATGAQERSLKERVALLEEQRAALIAQNADEMVELEERFKRKGDTESERAGRAAATARLVEEKDSLLLKLEAATKAATESDAALADLKAEAADTKVQLEAQLEKERRETGKFSSQLEAAQSERAKLRAALDALEAQLEAAGGEKAALVASLDSLSDKAALDKDAAARLKDAEASAAEAKAELDALRPYKKLFEEEQTAKVALESRLGDSSELTTLKHQVATLHNQRLAAEAQLSEARGEAEALKAERDDEVAAVERRLAEAEEEADKLREALGAKSDQLAALATDLETRKSADKDGASRLRELEDHAAALEAEKTALEKEKTAEAKRVTGLRGEADALRNALNSAQAIAVAREEEAQVLQAEQEELKAKLSEELLRGENEVARFQRLAQEAHTRLNLLQAEAESGKASAEAAATATASLSSAQGALADARLQLTAQDADLQELRAQMKAARDKLDEFEAKTDEDGALAALESELTETVSGLERDYKSRLQHAQISLDEAQKELEDAGRAEFSLQDELGEANIRIIGLEQELADLRSARHNSPHAPIIIPDKSPNCARCSTLESRVTELEAAVTSESGIEDSGETQDGGEASGLRSRLAAAEEQLLDLRTALSIQGSQESRKRAAEGDGPREDDARRRKLSPPSIPLQGGGELVLLAGENERLREEAFLLTSRLAAKEDLLSETVGKYRAQLKETTALGTLVQELWNAQGREGESEWRELEAKMGDLSGQLGREF